jgi:hypothetical protein
MVVGGHGDCPVEGLIGEGEVARVSLCQIDCEIKFPGVFQRQLQHLDGQVDAVKLEIVFEGEEIGAVGAADVEKLTLLPPFCQRLKLGAENGAVTEAVPARGNLVKNFPRLLFDDLTPLSENSKLHILNHQMSLRGAK